MRKSIALAFLCGCAGAAQAPAVASDPIGSIATAPATPPPAPSSSFATALADARARRDAAFASQPPTPPHPKPKRVALKFVREDVKDWVEATKPKVDQAEAAYAKAYQATTTAAERETALSEAIELDATFAERFVAAGLSGLPDEWRTNAEIARTYEMSIREAANVWVKRGRDLLEKCEGRCAGAGSRIAALEQAFLVASVNGAPPAPTPPSPTRTPACGCTAGDPLCTCGPVAKPQPARGAQGCKCAPADPLCSCL